MKKSVTTSILSLLCLVLVTHSLFGQRYMERLSRGAIAIPQSDGSVYLSWRLLATDSDAVSFNVYRNDGDGWSKINHSPIDESTIYIDKEANLKRHFSYQIEPLLDKEVLAKSDVHFLNQDGSDRNYLSVPIQKPEGGIVDGESFFYRANDASVADLDGDGEYEIILKWSPSNSKRPPQSGFTGNTIIDAYEYDGTLLWRINLGPNIRSGAAYTQFMVYDLDCDGKAEMVCKTADGSIDGVGQIIGDASADWRGYDKAKKKFYGRIVDGLEYLTVFDGQTGKARDTKTYIPNRYPLDGWGGVGGNGNNDAIGSRANRFSAGVAYLDGVKPSVVFCAWLVWANRCGCMGL